MLYGLLDKKHCFGLQVLGNAYEFYSLRVFRYEFVIRVQYNISQLSVTARNNERDRRYHLFWIFGLTNCTYQ